MPTTLKYTGTATRYFETAVTGRPTVWSPGRSQEVPDQHKAALLATGFFELGQQAALTPDEKDAVRRSFGTPVSVTTSRPLTPADDGCVLLCNSASPIYLTDPGDLGAGFSCSIVQLGAGLVHVIPVAAGAISTYPSGSLYARAALQSAAFGSGVTVSEVQAILTTMGATVWLPGVGEINFGFPLTAYSDTAAASLATAGGEVRALRASRNTTNLATPAPGSTFTSPPLLQQHASGARYLDFNTSNLSAFEIATKIALTNRINPLFVLAVAGITSSSGRNVWSMRWSTSASDRIQLGTASSTNFIEVRGNGFTITSAVALGASPKVMTFVQYGGSSRKLFLDGVLDTDNVSVVSSTGITPTSEMIAAGQTAADNTVNTGFCWRGPIYALVTAVVAPSDADRLKLEKFFGALAGIAIA